MHDGDHGSGDIGSSNDDDVPRCPQVRREEKLVMSMMTLLKIVLIIDLDFFDDDLP